MPIEFRILGPLEVSVDGRVLAPGSRKQRALLGLLLVHSNETVSRDRLIEELWPEAPPATVESELHVYLSRVRRQLEAAGAAGALVREAYGYRLRIEPDQLDANRFERLVGEGRDALAAGKPDVAVERLRQALALWRGPALADLQSESFAVAAATRLEEGRILALEQRLEADLALGRDHELVGELERLVADHPYRERLRAHLMVALYRSGRQVEALRVYHDARQTLATELALEPTPELKDLEQAILRQDPSLTLEPPATLASGQDASLQPGGREAPPREERKVVSVLFAELVSSRPPAERLDPEEVRAFQLRYWPPIRAEIERHGGTPEESLGVGLIALFGAPRAHEDDPERAVRAALAIRDWARREALEVRIAVTTGEALVRVDTQPFATGRAAVGEVIPTAALLERAAPPNGILVDDRTFRATREAIAYRGPAAPAARGKGVPAHVWIPLAARWPIGKAESGQRRTPLVGRDRELALLLATLARVQAARAPELVTLVGVPGIGKSRLVEELRDGAGAAVPDAIAWLRGRSLPYGDGVSFWALAEIIKGRIGALESDGDEQLEARLRRAAEAVLPDDREADWVARQLRPLVGIEGTRLAIGGHRDELFAAWRRFIEALAESRPLVLVFEDLQWADEALLDFVDGLAEWVSHVPLLVLATARPELLERRPHWAGGKQNAATLSLPPLSEEESARLLAVLSRHLPDTIEGMSSLVAKVGGNPFCAEQYAHALEERPDTNDLPLPETVQGMIAARLDMLRPEEKAVLQDAAVLGEVFSARAAAALDSGDHEMTDALLRALEHKEFVRRARQSSLVDKSEYVFTHVLLRDVAYAQIPRAARAAKHRRAAAWIESLGRPQDHVEALAHHYVSALDLMAAAGEDTVEISARTREVLRTAGDRATALNAAVAAGRYYERALELSPGRHPERPQLLFRSALALYAVGDPRQDEMLVQAREALLAAGELEATADAEAHLAKVRWFVGGHEEVERHLASADALVHGRPGSPAKARVLALLADLRLARWQIDEAIRAGREAIAIAGRLDLPELRAAALLSVGMGLFRAGHSAGVAQIQRGLEIALARNLLDTAEQAYTHLAAVKWVAGDLARRDQLLAEAEVLARRLGNRQRLRRLGAYRADGAFLRGEWDTVLRFADDFIAECDAAAPHSNESDMRAIRAMIRLAHDDADGALDDCEKAVALARYVGRPDSTPEVLAWAASVYLELGRVDDAQLLIDESLSYHTGGVRFVSPELVWGADACKRRVEVEAALAQMPSVSRWRQAGELVLAHRFHRAADVFARLGVREHEARARVRSAQELAGQARNDEAAAEVERALAFYRSVGATRYARTAEASLIGPPAT